MKNELEWDKKLNIDTIGRDAALEDANHYPYEPTPYSVLKRIVDSGYITADNYVVDYGSGKGRVGFLLNEQTGCRVLGIDFDERMYLKAQQNQKNYGVKADIEFKCIGAEKHEIEDADCFYFFNPFSVDVLKSVLGKIKRSYYDNPREMKLFFYYPSDEYVAYLMSVRELYFVDEIDCTDLFKEYNKREKILIFEMV